jgi:hypothetical protein
MQFPARRITDPSACLANFPVSMVTGTPLPTSIVVLIASGIIFSSLFTSVYFSFCLFTSVRKQAKPHLQIREKAIVELPFHFIVKST